MSYLTVSNEDPVDLDGYTDGSGNLQIRHDSDNLVDYDDEIHAEHDTSTSITVRLMDYDDGGTWTLTAEHEDGTTQTWTRGNSWAEYTFTSDPTTPFDVDITATQGGSTKEKGIKIRPRPKPST